jgi:hypothetical protein
MTRPHVYLPPPRRVSPLALLGEAVLIAVAFGALAFALVVVAAVLA